jgi:hypothetical protein
MKAKLFDAHNNFLQDTDVHEPAQLLRLPKRIRRQQPGDPLPVSGTTTFRLVDTDDSGALVYREVDDTTTASIEKSAAGEKAE